MQNLPCLLLIEDNVSLGAALYEAMQLDYAIDIADCGKAGLYKADMANYNAILLDLQLPDMYGLEVCQQLRERGYDGPILILSAEAKVLSKINLLDAGANDYLTKPFSLGELKARIRALLRQSAEIKRAAAHDLVIGDLQLDSNRHEVKRGDIVISLRRKEFLLLEYLMTHAASVVSREQLVDYAWHGEVKPWANTVDVHVKYLRDKIDRPFGHSYIKTVHGLGYKLVAEAPRQGVFTP